MLETYATLNERFNGDRVEALEAWMQMFPDCDPVTILGEDQDLVDAVG